MPESATDRPTSSYEHVFLLTKNGADPTFWTHERGKGGSRVKPAPDHIWTHKETGEERTERPVEYDDDPANWTRRNLWRGSAYWWDAEAVREAAETAGQSVKMADGWATHDGGHGSFHREGRERGANNGHVQAAGRNLRNVWTIPSYPYSEAHFATFPPKLVETCLKAGCPEKVCADCGAPYVREVERGELTVDSNRNRIAPSFAEDTDRRDHSAKGWTGENGVAPNAFRPTKTLGFSPSCDCQAETAPGTCLDPFGGSGTTGLVADRMKRNAVLIELSPEYAEMARRRIEGDAGLFAQVDLQSEAAA